MASKLNGGWSHPIDSLQIRAKRDDFKNMKKNSTPTNETATASLDSCSNHPYPLFHSWETLRKCHRLQVPLGLAKQRKKPGGTNISLLIRIPTQHWNRENELTKYGPKLFALTHCT
jgi:hypothetical protein